MDSTNALEVTKQTVPPPPPTTSTPISKIIMVASIGSGIQFGWALQLSLLTPYVQLLGIPHKWAAFIWLCGPISGIIVQPIVGYYSDRCTSRFGRRHPFIFIGATSVLVAVFLIGYAADIGHLAGDSLTKTPKHRAIVFFVIGFWIFDVANNTLQGPSRAFLADLCEGNYRKTRVANACFSFFMAIGNVLGYAAGSYNKLYKIFPFTKTKACDLYCANLKSCFFISITLLLSVTISALTYVREEPWSPGKGNAAGGYEDGVVEGKGTDPVGNKSALSGFADIFYSLKSLQKPMLILLTVNGLTWIAWFPFLLYDTDWMGREVYGGDSSGNSNLLRLYDSGVRAGALGLMLNSVVVGLMSLGLETLTRGVGGVKRLWGIVNFFLAVCLSLTILITRLAESNRRYAAVDGGVVHRFPPSTGIKAGALSLFTVMGIPLAITYSVPYALASTFTTTAGAGQGLSLGVLNLSIVVPQMIVSLVSGPWDALFGGGNLPAFVVGAIAAVVSGILAITVLPSPSSDVHPATTAPSSAAPT